MHAIQRQVFGSERVLKRHATATSIDNAVCPALCTVHPSSVFDFVRYSRSGFGPDPVGVVTAPDIDLFLLGAGYQDRATLIAHLSCASHDGDGVTRLLGLTPIARYEAQISIEHETHPCDVLVPLPGDPDLVHDALVRAIETQVNPQTPFPFVTGLPEEEPRFCVPGLDRSAFETILTAILIAHARVPQASLTVSCGYVGEDGVAREPQISTAFLDDEGEALAQRLLAVTRPHGTRYRSREIAAFRDNWYPEAILMSRRRGHTEVTALERAGVSARIAEFFARFDPTSDRAA